MNTQLISLLLISFSIFSCANHEKKLKKRKLTDIVIRKGEYKNGKLTGSITIIDPYDDTISFKEYVGGRLGIQKSYYSSGKVSAVSSYMLGSTWVNSFFDYDKSGNFIVDNCNIRLKKIKNKLIILFYKPLPDAIELTFKTNFSKDGSEIIENQILKPFNKQQIEIELKGRYYTKGRLNLIVDQIWQESPKISTSHEVFIQLDKNEEPDYYNIDPIDLSIR
ncbi:MAG: hypothetical protein RIR55_1518 [Bacteroidota bacterium]|jgi:antitoxin component YwqK of YwqJK toxin-antitoxin module